RTSGKAVPIFTTGEPNTFDENGQKAREMLKSDGDPYENALEAVKYFAKNRNSHNNVFVPLLKKGVDVISDRYWHSNFAFQHAQGISYNNITNANEFSRVPDLTFIIDVPVDVAFERLHNRDGESRRKFDSSKDFLNNVRDNYLELNSILPQLIRDKSIVIINGNQSVEKVFEEIKNIYKLSSI
ncbi:MAG TPA: hypothetical protein ENI61_03980, partial [Ignavibacteria bacterium]|nr:hypothetical protein [Ignavibacteria bacterium]